MVFYDFSWVQRAIKFIWVLFGSIAAKFSHVKIQTYGMITEYDEISLDQFQWECHRSVMNNKFANVAESL